MSTFRNPVGPQPARVYWRRRLVLILVLVAVVVAVVLIVVRPGGGATGAAPTPRPTESSAAQQPASSGTPSPAAPGDAEACDPARVTLEPSTDATSYDPGINPTLSFSLTSTMTVPCTLAVDTGLQRFEVTSGDELIWSSKDCQTDDTKATVLLMPGVPKAGSSVAWDRTRSSVDTCDAPREPVIAEGASYHLEVSVGEVAAKDSRQFLLY